MPSFPVAGDLQLTSDGRDLLMLDGNAKVLQSIRTRASIFKGSWRYDLNRGVPYLEEILLFGAGVELIRRRFHELILGTDGVTSVTRLDVRLGRATQQIFVDFACNAAGEQVEGTLDFVAA